MSSGAGKLGPAWSRGAGGASCMAFNRPAYELNAAPFNALSVQLNARAYSAQRPRSRRKAPAIAARVGVSMEDFKNAAASMIPVARVGQPDDIAHTVSFLVSEGAGFVSGQVIYVAGGPKD